MKSLVLTLAVAACAAMFPIAAAAEKIPTMPKCPPGFLCIPEYEPTEPTPPAIVADTGQREITCEGRAGTGSRAYNLMFGQRFTDPAYAGFHLAAYVDGVGATCDRLDGLVFSGRYVSGFGEDVPEWMAASPSVYLAYPLFMNG